MGLGLRVTGGLIRGAGDSLFFHAWNHFQEEFLPIDVSLFNSDSLRGIAHCPADIIPLWDLQITGGHEVSAFYSQPDADLTVAMTASFADPEIMGTLLDMYPLSFFFGRP
jgi:hypothetical protein